MYRILLIDPGFFYIPLNFSQFLRVSVVSVRDVHRTGERSAMLHRNLRSAENKNPESTDKYMKFGQLFIKKITKIIATRWHILRLKCTTFGVCPLDGVWH